MILGFRSFHLDASFHRCEINMEISGASLKWRQWIFSAEMYFFLNIEGYMHNPLRRDCNRMIENCSKPLPLFETKKAEINVT